MAEPGRAPAPEATLRITVDAQYKCNPKHGEVNNDGDVVFNVAPSGGCRLHTSPAQAFEGEASDGYITLSNGTNPALIPIVEDATIMYCTCAIGSTCNPSGLADDGGNSIKVGNPPEPGHRK